MNDKDVKDLKAELKKLSKNDLVRLVLKSLKLSEVYAEVVEVLKAENMSLKESKK